MNGLIAVPYCYHDKDFAVCIIKGHKRLIDSYEICYEKGSGHGQQGMRGIHREMFIVASVGLLSHC